MPRVRPTTDEVKAALDKAFQRFKIHFENARNDLPIKTGRLRRTARLDLSGRRAKITTVHYWRYHDDYPYWESNMAEKLEELCREELSKLKEGLE